MVINLNRCGQNYRIRKCHLKKRFKCGKFRNTCYCSQPIVFIRFLILRVRTLQGDTEKIYNKVVCKSGS